MSDPKPLSISLPLLGTYARVSDALAKAREKRARAVVSSDGKHFWLHPLGELRGLARHRQTATLQSVQEHPLPVLGKGQSSDVKLQLTELAPGKVERAFGPSKAEAIVTSVFHDFEGDRMVTAIIKPDGMFKLVGKVWRCPEDGETFPSPGICPTHGCDLERV
jgi:hypothetical protein